MRPNWTQHPSAMQMITLLRRVRSPSLSLSLSHSKAINMLSVAHGLENTNYRHFGIWAAIRTSPKTLPSDCANARPVLSVCHSVVWLSKTLPITGNSPPLLPSVGSRGRRRSRQEEQNRWGDRTPAASMGGPWPRPPRPYSFQLGRSSVCVCVGVWGVRVCVCVCASVPPSLSLSRPDGS